MIRRDKKLKQKQYVSEVLPSFSLRKPFAREALFSAVILLVLGFFGSFFLLVSNAESKNLHENVSAVEGVEL